MQNLDQLKSLGLAFMFTKNPKVDETHEQLREMFAMDEIPINSEQNLHNAKGQRATGVPADNKPFYTLDNSKICDILEKESGFQF
jgi:hypothetical protein